MDFAAGGRRVLNPPAAVANATDKRRTLTILEANGVRIPTAVTTLPENREGIWIARTILNGHSGAGIVVIRPGDAAPAAPLYTQYVKKKVELRLHVVGGKVIKVAERKKRRGYEHTENQLLIRSYDNGWVHSLNDIGAYDVDAVHEMAVKAVTCLGLDFGAVDLVIERDTNLPYVLEVNTAPGLTAPTVIEAYKTALLELANGTTR
jgi:glutathione synthase/RimK-type ligase-like ATP-grasp enzyme